MEGLDHPHVLPLIDSCVRASGRERYVVTRLMAGGSLQQRLFPLPPGASPEGAPGGAPGVLPSRAGASVGGDPIVSSWRARLSVGLGVLRGLAYLHGHRPDRILHRDVKVIGGRLETDD